MPILLPNVACLNDTPKLDFDFPKYGDAESIVFKLCAFVEIYALGVHLTEPLPFDREKT